MRWILLISLLIAAPAMADPGPFAQGEARISLGGGSSGQFGNRYIVIGGGFGYFVVDGLELGLDAQFFLGGDPQIYTVSPQVRYVFWQADPIRPYVGTFFRHQFIDGEFQGQEVEDLSSVGARAGIFYTTGRTYLGVGLAYEQILDCDKDVLEVCDEIYPEFGIAFSL